MKLDRPVAERFFALYREQFNPDLTVPDSVVEEWISVGTFRAKKIIAKRNRSIDVCRNSPALIIKSKAWTSKHNVKKQDFTRKPVTVRPDGERAGEGDGRSIKELRL